MLKLNDLPVYDKLFTKQINALQRLKIELMTTKSDTIQGIKWTNESHTINYSDLNERIKEFLLTDISKCDIKKLLKLYRKNCDLIQSNTDVTYLRINKKLTELRTCVHELNININVENNVKYLARLDYREL